MNKRFAVVPILIFALLITIGPGGDWLELSMVTHVLIQLPLLALIGVLLGGLMPSAIVYGLGRVNAGGIFGCICVSYLFLFWMIPRWLDASLTSDVVAYFKYLSLILGGIMLRHTWWRTHFITRGVLQIELLAMLYRFGWLYLISPERLCNSYLLTDQVWLGRGFLAIALALSITWFIPLFFGTSDFPDSTNNGPELKGRQSNSMVAR